MICLRCYAQYKREISKAKNMPSRNNTEQKVREEAEEGAKSIHFRRIKARTHHPFGRKSKARTQIVKCKRCGMDKRYIVRSIKEADEMLKSLKKEGVYL